MVLNINKERTKFMSVKRREHGGRHRTGQNVIIGEYNFEKVEKFKYLGVTITAENDINKEINTRIITGSRCMYATAKI